MISCLCVTRGDRPVLLAEADRQGPQWPYEWSVRRRVTTTFPPGPWIGEDNAAARALAEVRGAHGNALIARGDLTVSGGGWRWADTQTSVYPREVVKKALAVCGAAVIFAHNHRLGSVEPSQADEFLTQTRKTVLALVDVRVLDHLVVAGADVCSFAERGLV